MRRVNRTDAIPVGRGTLSEQAFLEMPTIGEFADRTGNDRGIYWGLWHRGLVGRPWAPYDHALDVYGNFPDAMHDDYTEDSDAAAIGPWQPIRERV